MSQLRERPFLDARVPPLIPLDSVATDPCGKLEKVPHSLNGQSAEFPSGIDGRGSLDECRDERIPDVPSTTRRFGRLRKIVGHFRELLIAYSPQLLLCRGSEKGGQEPIAKNGHKGAAHFWFLPPFSEPPQKKPVQHKKTDGDNAFRQICATLALDSSRGPDSLSTSSRLATVENHSLLFLHLFCSRLRLRT